jgi:hypothetical protein
MLCGLLLRLYDFPAPILPEVVWQDDAKPASKAEPEAAVPVFTSETAALSAPDSEAWPTSSSLSVAARMPSSERVKAGRTNALPLLRKKSAPPDDLRHLDAARAPALEERARAAPEASPAMVAPLPYPAVASDLASAEASSPASKAQGEAPAVALFPHQTTNKASAQARQVAGGAQGLAADSLRHAPSPPRGGHASLVIHYPANAKQWLQIAPLLGNPQEGEQFVWRLFAGDTKNAEVQALADYLRHTLSNGHSLSLHTDPALAAADVRLERLRVVDRK